MPPRVARKLWILVLLLPLILYMKGFSYPTPITTNKVSIKGASFNPPAEGDWIITQSTEIQDLTLTLNGSILIREGGNLNLQNVTLNFFGKEQHNLTVYRNGALKVIRSQISATNDSPPFTFAAFNGSKLTITGSSLNNFGPIQGDQPPPYPQTSFWINTANATFTQNNFSGSVRIYFFYAPNCTIEENRFNSWGVRLHQSPGGKILHNMFPQVYRGISLRDSPLTQLTGNIINIKGFPLINPVNNETQFIFSSGIDLFSSGNSTISMNTITNASEGIHLESSSYSHITGNNLTANRQGLNLRNVSYCTVVDNTLAHSIDGIILVPISYLDLDTLSWFTPYNLVGNRFSGNTLHSNDDGIYIGGNCTENIFTRNNISLNEIGIRISGWAWGNIVSENILSANDKGIVMGENCQDNVFWGNTLSKNRYGVQTGVNSSGNLFRLNNFLNNSVQVLEDGHNQWDDGVYGNYWSDYEGEDRDLNGIGDTPYRINIDTFDHHPLMGPWLGGPIIPPIFLLIGGGVTLVIVVFYIMYYQQRGETDEETVISSEVN